MLFFTYWTVGCLLEFTSRPIYHIFTNIEVVMGAFQIVCLPHRQNLPVLLFFYSKFLLAFNSSPCHLPLVVPWFPLGASFSAVLRSVIFLMWTLNDRFISNHIFAGVTSAIKNGAVPSAHNCPALNLFFASSVSRTQLNAQASSLSMKVKYSFYLEIHFL